MLTQKSSKELLIDSMIELLSVYPIEKITVSKIAENCSLSKRTFYYHFSDKYDLANKAYSYYMCKYCEENKSSLTLHGFFCHMAEFIQNHRYFFTNLTKYKGQNNIAEFNIYYMRKLIVQIIEESFGDPVSDDLLSIITFYVVGMTYYTSHIITEGPHKSRAEVIELFEKCVPDALRKYL